MIWPEGDFKIQKGIFQIHLQMWKPDTQEICLRKVRLYIDAYI